MSGATEDLALDLHVHGARCGVFCCILRSAHLCVSVSRGVYVFSTETEAT